MGKKLVSYSKARFQLKYRGTECRNCGHPLDMSDKFCPNCSQANSTKKLTLKDFFDEFFSNIISYDSRLLKTLAAMLLRPGEITKDYIYGKRVSYTNPFRFMLSLAIIYFLIWGLSGNYAAWDSYGIDGKNAPKIDEETLMDISVNTDTPIGVPGTQDSLEISKGIARLNTLLDNRDSARLSDPKAYFKEYSSANFSSRFFNKAALFHLLLTNDVLHSFPESVEKYGINEGLENQIAFKTAKNMINVTRQPGTFISKTISNLPFATFFFLPIFAIFIWLAYIRKKYNYTDHLIFSFHNQSLLFILLIISFLVDSIFNVSSGFIFVSIFSIYLYRAMRKFYGQGTFKTIVKYLFLNTIFFILASISVFLLFTGSLFTY